MTGHSGPKKCWLQPDTVAHESGYKSCRNRDRSCLFSGGYDRSEGARIRIGITRAFVAAGATTTGLVLPPRRQQHCSDSEKRVFRLSLFVSTRHGPAHRAINAQECAAMDLIQVHSYVHQAYWSRHESEIHRRSVSRKLRIAGCSLLRGRVRPGIRQWPRRRRTSIATRSNRSYKGRGRRPMQRV
jgi:hypothetical protein